MRNFFVLLWMCCLLACMAVTSSLSAEKVIRLNGHLSADKLAQAEKALATVTEEAPTFYLEIHSGSGDIEAVLSFAKKLSEKKQLGQASVIVFIDEQAVGPAAILPFLADTLYTSLFVTWGDIALGTEGRIPTNILNNQVNSLLSTDQSQEALLSLLSKAMIDPAVIVIERDHQWQYGDEGHLEGAHVVSAKGEALVVNRVQLQQLGLTQKPLSLPQFEEMFGLSSPALSRQPIEAVKGVAASFPEELASFISYNPQEPNLIGLIEIGDKQQAISQSTWIYVKKALEYYRELKPIFVILELNTPGGEVYAAQQISDALHALDTQYNIPIVCLINNWAISAGAMLAYSCRFITTASDGSMGAAEPVIGGAEGTYVAASEKINSALRADMANRARFYDRNSDIAEAMVDKDIILVWRYGQVVRLDAESQIRLKGPDPDVVITPKGKLLTLNAEDMLRYGVAGLVLYPQKIESVTEEERTAGQWSAQKMALFHAPFFKSIPNARIVPYQMDWKTQLFTWLTSPMVSSLLFLGLVLGAYIEINSPGFGLPGAIAALCLILILIASFSLEIANWLELILLLVGVLLVVLEFFLLPTGGIFGIFGLLFALVGLFGMMLPGIDAISFEWDTQTFNAAGMAFLERLAWLCGTLAVGVLLIMLLARYVMPAMTRFSPLVLSGGEQEASRGYISGPDPASLPPPGSTGVAMTVLKPSGKVIIADTIYEAITYGNFIEKDTPIVVRDLEGSVIVVDKQEMR